MKLFVFRPQEYGPLTYSVMAENEEEAVTAVKKFYEKENHSTNHSEWGGLDSMDRDIDGEPMYETEVYERGEVADNCND